MDWHDERERGREEGETRTNKQTGVERIGRMRERGERRGGARGRETETDRETETERYREGGKINRWVWSGEAEEGKEGERGREKERETAEIKRWM